MYKIYFFYCQKKKYWKMQRSNNSFCVLPWFLCRCHRVLLQKATVLRSLANSNFNTLCITLAVYDCRNEICGRDALGKKKIDKNTLRNICRSIRILVLWKPPSINEQMYIKGQSLKLWGLIQKVHWQNVNLLRRTCCSFAAYVWFASPAR